MVIDGTRYDELPIVHVYATRNNTIVTLTSYKGLYLYQRDTHLCPVVQKKFCHDLGVKSTGLKATLYSIQPSACAYRH
jgi:hypothetical protein